MAENLPSFKNGGALWFTDLTTPDATYILPVLTAVTFLITVEVVNLIIGDLYMFNLHPISSFCIFDLSLPAIPFSSLNTSAMARLSAICRKVWKVILLAMS